MPLTCCPTCGLTVYSAAGHSTKDDCPQCETELPPGASSVRREGVVTEAFLERVGQAQAAWLGRRP